MKVAEYRARTEDAAGVLLIRAGLFTLLLGALARSWADPDLWGHVRFGGDILRSGLPRSDPYSFTSDIPWVNHEWLAEVLMYLAWATAGNVGLILLKMSAIAGTLAFAWSTIRHDAATPAARDALLALTLIGLWSRVFVVRPQLFSVLLFAALLWILRSAERDRPARLWLLPLVFGLWVNLHGGWIVGFGVLAIWSAAAFTRWRSSAAPVGVLGPCVALAAAATLASPYGIGMWRFLAETVGVNRPEINDWRPIWDSGPDVILPWLVSAAVTCVAIVRGRRRIPLPHLVVVVGLGAASVRVNRLDVFFTLSAMMLLAPYVSAPATAPATAPLWTRRTMIAAAVLALVVLAAAWQQRQNLSCVRLDGPWMPEREAGAIIAAGHLEGRLLTWFDWGQYAIWHFAPALKVSLDGRRETVYSAGFISRHLQLYFQPDSAKDLLASLAPDYAWLPAWLPLSATLDNAGWHRMYSGPTSVIFSRERTAVPPVPALAMRACFPGP